MNLQNKSILVVDDDEDVLSIIVEALEEVGYQVDSATNVMEAYEIVTQKKIDLLITDMRMPGIHGRSLVQWIKGQENFDTLPIMVVSGYSDQETMDMLNHCGIHHVLHKPFDVHRLFKKVEQSLTSKG